LLATYRNGRAVSERHGISIATQFLHILAEAARSGISSGEFYRYQFYLPDRWRCRMRHFTDSQAGPAQLFLINRSCPPDLKFFRKDIFAARCKEVGLPCAPVLGLFIDGNRDGKLENLPRMDLFSKPTNEGHGIGAKLWQYNREQDCFVDAETEEKFSAEALLAHLCNLSKQQKQLKQVILQPRLRNHTALSPLTNGALSTLRIVTCLTPAGSIDLMPPVIRMPTGHSVVDNFSQGGLAAPIELATGVVCGAALKKDETFGVISMDKHPDSGQPFNGFLIPMWPEAIDLAQRAHETFRSIHFVGWDIAILEDRPIILEAHVKFNFNVTVLPHGCALSDTQFIPYYNYHWANSVR
jgi:hypothetical protein